jgi:hypothetical protein
MQRQVRGSQISKEKVSLEIFYEKVTEVLLTNAVQKIQAHVQTKRPGSRLEWKEQFVYRIPVTHARLEGKSLCDVCAE